MDSINPEIVEKLTQIRMDNYNHPKIQHEMTELMIKDVTTLVIGLSKKILEVNFNVNENEGNEYPYADLISELAKKDKVGFITFAAQLLQYYTMICNKDFSNKASFSEFKTFLLKHNKQLGDVTDNFLIIEYQFIKIFNEISMYHSSNAKDDVLKKMEKKILNPSLKSLHDELAKLGNHIKQWQSDSPKNVYIQYLCFIDNYTLANLLEFEFKLHRDKSVTTPPSQAIDEQKIVLSKAKDALENIERLTIPQSNSKKAYPNGIEYALGQNLFHHFPEKNLHNIKSHLESLLSGLH